MDWSRVKNIADYFLIGTTMSYKHVYVKVQCNVHQKFVSHVTGPALLR